MIIIEKASLYDAEAIATMNRIIEGETVDQDELEHAITEEQCYVAKTGEKPIGFALFHTSFFGFGYISKLAVDPAYRNRGAAKRLIETIKTACLSDKLFASTNQSNFQMQHLLESLRFQKSGCIANIYDEPEMIYCLFRKS